MRCLFPARSEEWGENGFGRIAMMPDGTYGACFMYYVGWSGKGAS